MSAHPIGYVELQTSWTGELTFDDTRSLVDGLHEKGLSENPGLEPYGARIEFSVDGAGVKHHTLYMGFAPKQPTAEPLNPHNLNDAPVGNIGDPARDNNIGWKEQKF